MLLDEDTPLFKFWKDIQNVEIYKKIISLTEGVYLLGKMEQGSNIFVRQCYIDLSMIIFDSDKLEKFCITGTPGIGKTFFETYMNLFHNELNKSDVWYFVDGHHPRNLWTWDEISACISKNIYDDSAGSLNITSKVLYHKVDYKKAKKLFGMWGGIPQVVLQKASTEAINLINQEMEGAIRICDLDMIVVDPKLDVNNKVVHIYTNVPDEQPDVV
nr:2875_t:CDS:2 [Entrophospora candida]